VAPTPPDATIKSLLAAIGEGGSAAYEAALTLGLLLEERPHKQDAVVTPIVGHEFAARRLTAAEKEAAVDGLIEYLQTASEPRPMAVWALTKSYEIRAVPTLIMLLDRFHNDAGRQHLAYQALIGVVTTGVTTSRYRELSLQALRRAADSGGAELAETARDFLAISER
jgi:hypothetical protein